MELDRAWEHFWFPRSEKNTQTEWCSLSLCSHPLRCLTLLSNLTMPLSLFTSLLRMQMNVWFWIMKLCMIFASVLSSSPRQAVSQNTFWRCCCCLSCRCLFPFHAWLWKFCWSHHLFLFEHSWRLEPPDFSHHEWCNLLPSFPWSTQLRSTQACC